MEAVRTSETSANFYETTRPNIPEDSHFHTRRLENLQCHNTEVVQSQTIKIFQIQHDRIYAINIDCSLDLYIALYINCP
jgi:hypothetical protein